MVLNLGKKITLDNHHLNACYHNYQFYTHLFWNAKSNISYIFGLGQTFNNFIFYFKKEKILQTP